MYKLVIEDDEGKTTVVPLIRDEITVGRKEGNTIRLTERNVSRRHARLIKNGDEIQIENVESRYGTRHNGEKISSRVPFREGDVVMIGDYRLSLQLDRSARKKPEGAADGESTLTGVEAIQDDPDEIPIEQAGKLVVISSNYAGREYRLTRKEMVIGRTEGDIRIDHRSISRNHAKLVRDGDRYKIVDLRSSNGVRVNGEEYRSVHLKKGDVIELGHVRFRYVEAGEVFRFTPDRAAIEAGAGPSPAGGGVGKLVAIGAVLVVFLVIAGVIGVIVIGGGGKGEEKDKGNPPTVADAGKPPVAPDNAEPVEKGNATEMLAKADKYIEQEEWDKAVTVLDIVLDEDPNNANAREKKSLAQKEKPFKDDFDKGKEALDAKRYQDSLDAFDRLPGDPSLSLYSMRVKNQGLREQAREGLLGERLTRANDLVRRKDWNAAARELRAILDLDSSNADAQRLLRTVQAELKKAGQDDPVASIDKKDPKKDDPKDPGKTETPPGDKTPPAGGADCDDLLNQASKANVSGNPQQAIQLANEAIKCGKGGARATFILASAYEKLGNNAQAVQYYNKWLQGNSAGAQANTIRQKIIKLGGTPVN